MKITDALLGEHAMLYALFSEVNRQISEECSIEQLQVLVDVLANQLGTHSKMEDDHLFPALMANLSAIESLTAMRAEHAEVENLLTSIKAETNIAQLKSLIEDLINLAKVHFQKEELVLFSVVQESLREEQQLALGSVWAIERKVIVNGNRNPRRAAD
jgi:iron-sulfur cluster repair protein YtfE (RIC family)